ncbi:unnamed protein product [Amoebophrya sp. A25]|nr:unnamed protein product [Amoebophrya sp. A25]|eukprot:GSA25T00016224001.1
MAGPQQGGAPMAPMPPQGGIGQEAGPQSKSTYIVDGKPYDTGGTKEECMQSCEMLYDDISIMQRKAERMDAMRSSMSGGGAEGGGESGGFFGDMAGKAVAAKNTFDSAKDLVSGDSAQEKKACEQHCLNTFGYFWEKEGMCFAANATVEVRGRGCVRMRALCVGDEVRMMDGSHEPVLCWLHRHETEMCFFLEIHVEEDDEADEGVDVVENDPTQENDNHIAASADGALERTQSASSDGASSAHSKSNHSTSPSRVSSNCNAHKSGEGERSASSSASSSRNSGDLQVSGRASSTSSISSRSRRRKLVLSRDHLLWSCDTESYIRARDVKVGHTTLEGHKCLHTDFHRTDASSSTSDSAVSISEETEAGPADQDISGLHADAGRSHPLVPGLSSCTSRRRPRARRLLVKDVRVLQARGYYCPLLPSGEIVVDGVRCSCYALPHCHEQLWAHMFRFCSLHSACHLGTLPLRLLCQAQDALAVRSGSNPSIVGQRQDHKIEARSKSGEKTTTDKDHGDLVESLVVRLGMSGPNGLLEIGLQSLSMAASLGLV